MKPLPFGYMKGLGSGPLLNTKSLNFDGVDDYIDCGNILDKDGTTPFSISAWIKCPSDVSEGVIASRKRCRSSSTGKYAGYEFVLATSGVSKNKLYVEIEGLNVSGPSSGTLRRKGLGFDFNDDLWHHVVMTYDGSEDVSGIKLYKDGAEWTTFATYQDLSNDFIGPIAPNATIPFCIGGDLSNYNCNSGIRAFIGNIDEVSFFDYELSAPEVQSIYEAASTGETADLTSLSPVAWYRMGDNSTYQAPQILMPLNTNIEKVSNYSMTFDGVDDYVDCGDILDFTGSFSLSAWIKTTTDGMFLAKDSNSGKDVGNNRKFIFQVLATGKARIYIFHTNESTSVNVESSASVDDGDWHHIAAVNDTGGNLKIYVDGADDSASVVSGVTPLNPTTVNTLIGAREYPGSQSFFTGTIDEVSAFDSALSDADVLSMYNSGTPTTITGAVAYWRMGEGSKFTSQWLVPNQMSQDTAFDFDGSTEYINTGSSSQDGASALTISAWFNTSYDGWQYFFGDNSIKLNIKQSYPDRVDFTFNGSIDYRSTNFTITLGTWNHVALVFDGSLVQADRLKIYLNNSLLTNDLSGTSDTTFVANNNFMLGRAGTYSLQEWNGNLSEISVFNTAKDAGDVSVLYNSGTPGDLTSLSPVNWWKLDKSATFDGTNWIIPDATITPTYTSAIVLPSTYQNPPASYTSVTRSTTTWSSDHITLSFWVKFPYGWQSAQNIMHADGFTIESFQATTIQFGHNTWYKNFTLNNAYDGAWHNFIVYIPNNATIDVIDVRVWEDGQEIIGSTVGSTPAPQITTISGWGHGTFAELSNWALFDTDLSSAGNIATLYNNGTPGDISSLNPVTWYKCDEANVDFPSPVTNYISFTDSSDEGNTGACAYDSDATPPDPHRPYMATTNVQAENGVSSGMTQANLVRTPISFSNVYSKFSFAFDGVDDYIDCGDTLHNDGQTPMTVSAWVKITTAAGHTNSAPVANKKKVRMGPTYLMSGWAVDFITSGAQTNRLCFSILGDGSSATGTLRKKALTLSFTDGLWHNIVVTYDGSEDAAGVKFYIDGTEDTNTQTLSDTFSGTLANDPTVDFQIGKVPKYGGTNYMDGNIDELAIWNSVQDISTIWNGGQPADLTSLSPTAWYRMGEDAHYNAAVGVSGNTTADAFTFQLNDGGATFLSDNISIGDLVRNTTDDTITHIAAIVNDTQIIIDDDIFPVGTSSGDGYKITGPVVWTVPDQIGSNDGTSVNMAIQDLQGEAPNYSGAGTSSNMYIKGRIGNAPDSDKNALSYNMYSDDIENDVP